MTSLSSPGIPADFTVVAPAAARRPQLRFRVPVPLVMGFVWICDILALTASGLLTCALSRTAPEPAIGSGDLLLAMVAAWASITVLQQLRVYRLSSLRGAGPQGRAILAAVLVGAGFFAAGAWVQQRNGTSPGMMAGSWAVVTTIVLACVRATSAAAALRLCAAGLATRRVAVVGSAEGSRAFLARLNASRNPALDVVGLYEFGDTAETVWGRPLAQLESDSRHGALDAVILAMPDADETRIGAIRQVLDGIAVDIYLAASPRLAECPRIERLGGVPAGLIARRPLSDWQSAQKAVFDRIGAALLLLIAAPAMALIALLIRLDSRGPILFRQWRTGYNNVPFVCYKFRSMYDGAPDGDRIVRQAVRGDARITRMGAILRRTSLDELPQLFNVLFGDMSLVGPRPHAPTTRAAGRLFEEIVPNYHLRHVVKPGITGLAQVHGLRGETPTEAAIEARVRYDLEYVRNWSMLLDLRILLRTALTFLHDPNAF